MLIRGWCAFKFDDLKKIVALSTCNNIAWCLIFYVYGSLDLAVYQLLSHGVSKCVLFMLVGDVMSRSGGRQTSKGVYMVSYMGCYGPFLLGFLIFSLCGLPFIGIFYSKHFMFRGLCRGGYNMVCRLLVFIGFMISYIYSSRFVFLLCGLVRGLRLGWLSKFLLIAGLVLLGRVVNLFCIGGLEEYSLLGWLGSAGFIVIQLLGLVIGWLGYVSV